MRGRKLAQAAWHVATWGEVLAAGAVTILGASLEVEPKQLPTFEQALIFIHGLAWAWLPVLAILVGLLEVARRRIGSPWRWEVVHQALDELRDLVFTDRLAGDPLQSHRVTLFRYRSFKLCFRRWPWSGWLVAVHRSGHTSHKRTILFKAPDDALEVEGVAGRTWAEMRTVRVSGLPNLGENFDWQSRREYAESSWVTETWVTKHRPSARSMCGIPVEVAGKPWGVVVLDSTSQEPISKEHEPAFRLVASLLSKLVKGV